MADSQYNLLQDSLLTVDCPGRGALEMNLCQALAEIGLGTDLEFSNLRAHQHHAWYSALVMISALALHRVGETKLPSNEARWQELLLALTDGTHEPWCLIVEDVSKPAFFQPPFPEEQSISVLKATVATPDGLDVLITAKNHDVKAQRVANPRPEHWMYALVTLQTMQGFLGAGNYGISRMNGGFASRPAVSAAPGLAWAKRFARDVGVVLAARKDLVSFHKYQTEGGLALLWMKAWDGTESIEMTKLDPFYVEICRRVRFVEIHGAIVARTAPTKAPRVAAGVTKGNTGDVWTPIKKSDKASLTVSPDGLSYKTLYEVLLSNNFLPGQAAKVQRRDPEKLTFFTSVLVRGQGKTEGFHERAIPVPPVGVRYLRNEESRNELGARAERWVKLVADVRSRALHPAICALLQGAPDKLNLKDDRAYVFSRQLDDTVDPIFFDRLWRSLETGATEADARWATEVVGLARAILDRATRSAPLPSTRRYKAISAAESVFFGSARKNFPNAFPIKTEVTNGPDAAPIEP